VYSEKHTFIIALDVTAGISPLVGDYVASKLERLQGLYSLRKPEKYTVSEEWTGFPCTEVNIDNKRRYLGQLA